MPSRTLERMAFGPSRPAAAPATGRRRVGATQALALFLSFVLMATLGGVLTAGLVVPAVGSVSLATDTAVELFADLPDDLEFVNLSEKSTVHAADGTLLATFFDQNRIIVGLDEISLVMQQAVVATEDRRFYDHGAVDLVGMARAMVRNQTTDQQQGGSTLTQQYVKNALIQAALLNDNAQERQAAIEAARESEGAEGYARKLQEAKYAVSVEQRMSKDEILNAYLNIAQFGASVYGVEAAAQFYFSVPAAQLNYLQAATIAGITKAPSEYDPTRNPAAAEERRNIVLSLMLREGYITQAEHDQGVATPLAATLLLGEPDVTCAAANAHANSGYFCDYVTKIIANDDAFGATATERRQLLYRGGLTITTTLDLRLQALADTAVKEAIPVLDESGVAHAMSVIEPGTGRVLALAQNRIYNASQNAGPGETAVNYNTDAIYGSSTGFAPGSTFKPFTLVQWLKEGHSLEEVIDARLRPYQMSEFEASCTGLGGPDWKFGNAEGSGGVMSVLEGTMRSVNSAYVAMASELDLCGIFEGAKDLGIHQASGAEFAMVPGNVLGSDSVAPLTMAAAFAAFAANGMFCDPIAITSVTDSDGRPLQVPEANCRQAISPEIASAMNFALSHVWQGTGRSIGALPDRVSAGKTGTTTHNEHTWFVGYTPQLAAAVWTGYAEGMIPVQGKTINGRYYRVVYGSDFSGPTWRRFMVGANEGLEVLTFSEPNPAQVVGVKVTVPEVSGMSVDAATSTLRGAGFHLRTAENTPFSGVPAGNVAWTDPAPGTRLTKGSLVTLVISAGPEPAPPPPPPAPEPPPAPPAPPAPGGGDGGGRGDRGDG